ncbi:MAG TPA: histidine phosphatase family protein [Burkholderiales bacterium]|mgnify:CR=1 FL=1|nr:histidine phosphatase family protein [Burkholderiales bacterium]
MYIRVFKIIFLLFFITNVIAKDKMVFAIDVIRHGDRTPINEIPNDPYNWAEGLGELTALGMNQEYKLGQSFNKMYINKLLPANYSAKSLYVRSSDYNRTLMSAQSVLLGLYPTGSGPLLTDGSYALPNAFQPVPIHTDSENNEVLFIHHKNADFKKVVNDNVYSTKEWQKKNEQYKDKFIVWNKATGFNIKDLQDIITLGDNLHIRKLHGVPLPKNIDEVEAQEIMALANWAMVTIYKSYPVALIARGKLLNVIVDYLQHAINDDSNPLKYVLFSGHDTTILALLSSLHAPALQVPSYASDLKFILFKKDNKAYYINISLNGKRIKIPSCHQINCTLDEFIEATAVISSSKNTF